MSIDDQAEAMEQLDRDVCLTQRKPEVEHTGQCLNCSEPTPSIVVEGKELKGAFCCKECGEDYEKRMKFNLGREE